MAPQPATATAAQRTTWIRFAGVAQGIPAELNSRLLAESGLSQFEYLVLNHLILSEGQRLPMTRLAVLLACSLSRLSHVVSRLEQEGCLTRSKSPDDRRVAIAALSERGARQFRAAAPGYFASVRELFFDRLDARDLADLDRVMTKLLPGVDAGGILAPLVVQVGARTDAPTRY
jgi:DNA-binding MarR family transcriptional regulator